MLLDRIRELKHQITFIDDIDRLKREADKFRVVAAEFRALTDELATLSNTATLLIDKEIDIPDMIVSGAASHRAAFQKIRERYDANPETILIESRGPRQNLKQWNAQQIEAIRASWADYIAAAEPEISDELTRIFQKIPSFAPTVTTLRKLQAEIASLKSALPRIGADFQRAEALAQRMRAAVQSLEGEGIPPRVLLFLRKMAAGDARLDLLDEEILGWLRDRSLLREFQVKPASGP